MGWYGKLIGAVLGGIIGRGLLGAIAGLVIGHQFDRRARDEPSRISSDPRSLSLAFFRATFQAMGHVAKSDGRVTDQEIDAARQAMRRFSLSEQDVRRAIDLFTEGKRADFPLEEILGDLRAAAAGREDLARLFVQIQLEAALQGGGLNPASRNVFARMCSALGISAIEFAALEAMLRMQGSAGAGGAARPSQPGAGRLSDAYQVLGVRPDASDADVTLAYRRLMSQNHPDKLVANGLPESMIEAAHERTRRILEAYEVVRTHRGIK
ncbi:MAG: co-chaperone DjlA [Gammaproteobacteria bacterium]|nr:co-chaperone DjlA [Gammaproteobacteria bacterium]